MKLSKQQHEVARAKLDSKTYLSGMAGTGKSTAGVERLKYLLEFGIPANEILILLPQQTLAFPYTDLLNDSSIKAGGQVNVTTVGGIARQIVDVFWVLVAKEAGFKNPNKRPTFLSLETAQYYMARLVNPLIEQRGFFDTVTIDRNRLFSQLIDNLNKASLVSTFDYTQVAERLKSAWQGSDVQLRMYDDVQESIALFRTYCLENSLLDFSLTMELFVRLWELPQCKDFLFKQYKHLIFDNIEEDTPVAHDLARDLTREAESALLIYDSNAGYRIFLGADATGAKTLKQICDTDITFEKSFVTNKHLDSLGDQIAVSLNKLTADMVSNGQPKSVLIYDDHRYYTEMVQWITDEVASLVHDHGVNAEEIVILSPYLSDALRFALMNRLKERDVPVRSHRPSRSLREEPATVTLLTLARLAHPQWRLPPAQFDVIYALMMSIEGLDLVRAQLLGRGVYREEGGQPILDSFDRLPLATQERISFTYGNQYDKLREWIQKYIVETSDSESPMPLDHFLSKLFGEVLSQDGFGFHTQNANLKDTAEVAANLINSARKFRWIIGESNAPIPDGKSLAQEYVEMVGQGIIADQYLRRWETQLDDAVLIAPAYTFLMSNRPVDYQFWLNVGGHGWAQRLYQPLTNPYVLSNNWHEGDKWTDAQEVEKSEDALYKLASGLIRRCRKSIYLGYSELGEQGYEQRGTLLDAIQKMLRRLQP